MLQAFNDDKDFPPPAAQQDAYTWFPACREVALVGLQSVLLLYSYSQSHSTAVKASAPPAGRLAVSKLEFGKNTLRTLLEKGKKLVNVWSAEVEVDCMNKGSGSTCQLLESVILSKYSIISTQLTLHFSGMYVSVDKK